MELAWSERSEVYVDFTRRFTLAIGMTLRLW